MFSSTCHCKGSRCFYLCRSALFRTERMPSKQLPNYKISNNVKYNSSFFLEMIEETVMCTNLKTDALFLHTENLCKKVMKRCLNSASTELASIWTWKPLYFVQINSLNLIFKEEQMSNYYLKKQYNHVCNSWNGDKAK